MISLPPDGVSPEMLAAYVDGELTPALRDRVEQWLTDHPELLDQLRTQRVLSPENCALWQQAEPPQPSENTWATVRHAIAEAVLAPSVAKTSTRYWWVRVGAVAAAAVVLVGSWLIARLLPQPRHDAPATPPPIVGVEQQKDDPLAEFAILPVATEDEIEIQRVAGNMDTALPVGTPILSGPLVLAGKDDVKVEVANPHPAWGADGPKITTAPGDAAMIYAAPPR